jgi:O-antigen/teichoic acid export membrane protein
VLIRRRVVINLKHINQNFCKQLARRASPFFVISMIAAIYEDIDKFFLFSMEGGMAIGLYAAAYKLATIPTRFSNAFHQALYPVLSQQMASPDRQPLIRTYRQSMRYLLLGAVPLTVGTTVLAEPIMGTLYGEPYIPGATALQVIIWAYGFEFFNPFFTRILFAAGRQRIVLAAAILGAGSNILLNIILIPHYSFVGAAMATLGSAVLVFIYLFAPILRMFPDVPLYTLAVKPALAGLLMWLVCTLMSSLPLILLALLGSFVYCGSLLLTGAFLPEDLLILRRLRYQNILARGKVDYKNR